MTVRRTSRWAVPRLEFFLVVLVRFEFLIKSQEKASGWIGHPFEFLIF